MQQRQKKPKLRRRSITERWVMGSLLVTISVVAVAAFAIIVALRQSYYGSARQVLEYRTRMVVGEIEADEMTSPSDRYYAAFDAVETFADKERFELMLLTADGKVIATSSGFEYPNLINSEDFYKSASSMDLSTHIGFSSMGEHYVSATMPIGKAAGNIFAVRMISSLDTLDRQLVKTIYWAVLLSLVVIAVSVATGLYFVRSIVRPIQRLGESAKLIAAGNYSVRVHNPIDDEIGELCDIINEMAVGLNATERAKNDFISSVSHELRTPLTSIRGWTETLLASDPAERAETYKKGLSIISDETVRLYDMVEDLLDFSRIESGRMSFAYENLDIVAELADAVLVAQPRAAKLGISIYFDEPETPVPVYADSIRMKQVFVNLLDNAVKYSSPGSGIEAVVADGEETVFIRIQDHGIGIPKADMPFITQKFFKARNSVNGSGIGLAVVKEIVDAHGGTLELDSELGMGTTVTVALPKVIKEKRA